MSVSGGVKLGSNPWSAGLIPPALSRRRGRDGGGLRKLPIGDQIDRGLVLRVAGARAHLVGQVGGAGVERTRRNRARGGGRSSAVGGFAAAAS